MNRETVIAKLKEIVRPYTYEKAALEHLDENTDFLADLKINSANLVDIVLDVEEAFGIEIDNESMSKMLTVSETLQIIENKLNPNDRK
jgi:acyl carrier protein